MSEALFLAVVGVGAAVLQAAGFVRMALVVARGEAVPNACSWLIWSVVATLAAASSWQAGATWPLAGAVMNAAGCLVMLGLALKFGTFQAVAVDLVCLGTAALGLAAWIVTDDPIAGLLLFLGADACGAIPTLRHVIVDPSREDTAGWALLAMAGVAAVASVEPQQWAWTWESFGYWGGAVYVALVNLTITACTVLVHRLRRIPDAVQALPTGQ
ncbi:MAG: hypothetical protein U1E45_10565 [Geminicoccaceae bacterium]